MPKKRLSSVPGATFVPCFLSFGVIVYIISFCIIITEEIDIFSFCLFLMLFALCLIGLVISLTQMVCMIELHEDELICKIPMKKEFSMKYESCDIGMDYHIQNGRKVWWIYLCIGRQLPYNVKNPRNRINTVKCHPGFVRIMYSEDAYQSLLDVLPPQKCTALVAAKRNSGFEGPN